MPSSPSTGLQDGSLQFEVTDFSDARRALEEPPAGLEMARQVRPTTWDSRRRAPLSTDHALGGRTLQWILSLRPDSRPVKLADSIPRIANEIAERWHDSEQTTGYLMSLLVDSRGGRKGFPSEIKRELVALHLLARRHRPGTSP